jgi:hypothetical protein
MNRHHAFSASPTGRCDCCGKRRTHPDHTLTIMPLPSLPMLDPTPPTLVGLKRGLDWFNDHRCVDYMGSEKGEVFVRVNCGRLKSKEENPLTKLGWHYETRDAQDLYIFKMD